MCSFLSISFYLLTPNQITTILSFVLIILLFCLFFKKFIYLFIYFIFWLLWVFIVARGLFLVAASGGYSSLQCTGFSLRWLLLLWSTGTQASVVVAHGLSSCGSQGRSAQAQLLRGMWDLPGPGLEPVSPALAGGFLTTAPPGKSSVFFLMNEFFFFFN